MQAKGDQEPSGLKLLNLLPKTGFGKLLGMLWSRRILLSFNTKRKGQTDFSFKQDLSKKHMKCIQSACLKNSFEKNTQAFIQSHDIDWAKKISHGDKISCRSTVAGRTSNECRLRRWEPGSWKTKWVVKEWRKDGDIQGLWTWAMEFKLQVNSYRGSYKAGVDGASALPAWVGTSNNSAGKKWHKISFNGSDFILFYSPLVVHKDKQSPCTAPENSQNRFIWAHLKAIWKIKRQTKITDGKWRYHRTVIMVNNSYSKFREYFD